MPPRATPMALSESESRLFAAFVQHVKSADADWNAIAAQAGYKNATNAKTMFGRFKAKLQAADGGSPRKRGSQEAEPQTPSKRAKVTSKTTKSKHNAAESEEYENNDDEEVYKAEVVKKEEDLIDEHDDFVD